MPRYKVRDLAPPWQWGIFKRRPCKGLSLQGLPPELKTMQVIYEALKKRGFKETYWQVVYPGQIGGLIRNPGNNILQFHVRFFSHGMIYAEFELGRSALLHFIIRKFYVNNYIGMKISADLSSAELEYFYQAVLRYKTTSEKGWPEWTGRNKLVNAPAKKIIRMFSAISDWRVLFLAMLLSMAAIYARDVIILPILSLIMILFYIVAPKKY